MALKLALVDQYLSRRCLFEEECDCDKALMIRSLRLTTPGASFTKGLSLDLDLKLRLLSYFRLSLWS